jgi:hypothetical protein
MIPQDNQEEALSTGAISAMTMRGTRAPAVRLGAAHSIEV